MSRRSRLGALVAAGLLGVWAAAAPVVLAPSAVAGASPIGRTLANTEPCSTPLSTATLPKGPAIVSSALTRFGPALVVGSGPYAGCSLYLLTSDTPANPATYGCTGVVCAVDIWPALLTTGRPMAGTGVNPTLLGTVARNIDGQTVHEVTYGGYPLYRFSLDQTAGDTAGEQFFDAGTNPAAIWYLVSPGRGTPDPAPTRFADETVPLVHPGATTSYGTADVLTVELDQGLGLGGQRFPVYTSSADMHHMSLCDSTADCALHWPAVLTSGRPMATGPIGGMLGTTGRPPGMHQVTFDGRPLYVFILDAYFPPGSGPPSLPHAIAAHGTGIHPTFTGLDVGTFRLVPAP